MTTISTLPLCKRDRSGVGAFETQKKFGAQCRRQIFQVKILSKGRDKAGEIVQGRGFGRFSGWVSNVVDVLTAVRKVAAKRRQGLRMFSWGRRCARRVGMAISVFPSTLKTTAGQGNACLRQPDLPTPTTLLTSVKRRKGRGPSFFELVVNALIVFERT